MNERVKKITDMLYELLNMTSTDIDVDGNKVHMFMDCFGEWDMTIDPESIKLCNPDTCEWY